MAQALPNSRRLRPTPLETCPCLRLSQPFPQSGIATRSIVRVFQQFRDHDHEGSGSTLGLLANGGAANGRQLLSQESIRQFTQPHENPLEIDEALGMSTWIGVGGYWLGGEHPPADPVVGTSRRAFWRLEAREDQLLGLISISVSRSRSHTTGCSVLFGTTSTHSFL